MNQIKNIIIGVGIGFAFLGLIVWLAKPSSSDTNTQNTSSGTGGALTAQETSYDFGTVSMKAGKVSHAFKIKNTGSGPITLTKVYTSCMCTQATLVMGSKKRGPFGMQGHGIIPKINEVLDAEKDAEVEVVFDPAAHGPAGVGRISRAIYLENNQSAPFELQISANVTP